MTETDRCIVHVQPRLDGGLDIELRFSEADLTVCRRSSLRKLLAGVREIVEARQVELGLRSVESFRSPKEGDD